FLAQPWHLWLYQAMALLLVACPCALVISAPVSIVSAIGGAARRGVLIKGGVHLEQAGSLAVIAFDKTGTLTRGRPEVTDIIDWSGNEDRLLAVAAAIESRSEHPLADAVLQSARQRGLPVPAVTDFEALVGQGARGNIDGELYLVGNMRIFAGYDLPPDLEIRLHELQNQGKSIILVGNQKKLLGLLAVADIVRSNSPAALESLRRHGIRKLVMLTGDNPATAGAIARQTGVDEFSADLMPEDKVQAVRELLARHGKVAMVGDGVNDAPAMAIATVGIAMGTAGTDAALETADIALMGDDLSRLAYTIHLGRQTVRVLKQNIAFAVVVKVIIMLMALPGWLTLWLAVLGDMGTSLLVTLNGMRLMWMRDQAPLK
ncbi:MAG: heavy metal translocating P-type ATPase, partial [Syntrophomonadaceae bacterium]|nr:heavy metal translocating P-type ATPase [Syntrophomonadaceae bacterium]